MELKRTEIILQPNNTRVVFRPFEFIDSQRALRIVARVMALPDAEVNRVLEGVLNEFHGRHQKLRPFFLARFQHARQYLLTDQAVSENRQLLIGAYFTQEYSLESAALFNPSMVWHPDQSIVPQGSKASLSASAPPARATSRRSRSAAASSTSTATSRSIKHRAPSRRRK